MMPVSGMLQNAGGFGFSFFLVFIFLNWKCSDNNLQKVRKKYPRVRGGGGRGGVCVLYLDG